MSLKMVIVVYFVVGLIFAFIGAGMARSRNRDTAIWALVCFLFPLLGVIVLAIAGNASLAAIPASSTDNPNRGRWEALIELDPEVAAAAEKARAAGPQAERLLAEKYLALNDKQYLQAALSRALEQAESMPASGKIGKSQYKMNPDGTYVVTSGRQVGRKFDSFAELQAACS